MLFQTTTVDDACGDSPGAICRVVFEQTDNQFLAQVASILTSIVLILAIAWIVARLLRRQIPRAVSAIITRREAESTRRESERELTREQVIERNLARERARQRTETLGGVLGSVVVGVVWFIAAVMVLGTFGIALAPLIAGAGVVGIAIGFGAQKMVQDFLAGIFIVMEDQFGVGDVVDLGQATGTVEQVGLRITRLRDVDGVVWYVPNGEIVRVGNMSKLWSRAVLDIEVSYDTDLDAAGAALKEEAVALWKAGLPDCTIIAEPEFWGIERFNADGIVLRLVVQTEPTEQWATARALRGRIMARFTRDGIEVPFPQRTVWLRAQSDSTESDSPASDSPASGNAEPDRGDEGRA